MRTRSSLKTLKDRITYFSTGFAIGVLVTVIFIFVFGFTPQSITVGMVDFKLPTRENTNPRIFEAPPTEVYAINTSNTKVYSLGNGLEASNSKPVTETGETITYIHYITGKIKYISIEPDDVLLRAYINCDNGSYYDFTNKLNPKDSGFSYPYYESQDAITVADDCYVVFDVQDTLGGIIGVSVRAENVP